MKCSTRLFVLSLFLMFGCSEVPTRDPAYAATFPAIVPQPVQQLTGSIYESGYNMLLFEDAKARRIGDILTVALMEDTNSSKSSSTSTDREQTTNVENPTLFGTTPEFNLPGVLPLATTDDLTLESNLSSSHEFSGSADSDQSNSLSGTITVSVAQVLPNGNLVVRGEKRLNLNRGNEYIKLSGIVRPIDIGANNTVPSTKVADATIIYSQDGELADANKLGFLARFFISAIFPF